jgi:hypothetical protein
VVTAKLVTRGLALEARGISARATAAQLGVGYQSYLPWTGHFSPLKANPIPRPAPRVRVRKELARFVMANRKWVLWEMVKGLDDEPAQDIIDVIDCGRGK